MKKMVVKIEGMMCEKCAAHVVEALKKIPGVKTAEASNKDKQAIVTAKDNVTDSDVTAAVAEAGYTVTELTEENIEKKGLFSFLKK